MLGKAVQNLMMEPISVIQFVLTFLKDPAEKHCCWTVLEKAKLQYIKLQYPVCASKLISMSFHVAARDVASCYQGTHLPV